MRKVIGTFVLMILLLSFQSAPKKQVKPHLAGNTSMARGKMIYMQRCLVCHQPDGGGVPNLNAPLDGASAVVGKDKAKIIRITLQGMSERVEIDGERYNNNMAPQSDLSDQQIADVLTYIRNTWTNKASIVTPAEVKAVRAKTK